MLYLLYSLFSIFLASFLTILNITTKSSGSVEAGFDPLYKSSEGFFSLQFILLIIIFIVFDLELLFLLMILFNPNGLVLFFVVLTLLLEWSLGSLKWLV